MTVLGAGVQAYWQTLALYSERRFNRLVIWARNLGKAEALKRRLQPHLPTVEVEISVDLEPAIRLADVIITATQARQPLIHGAWLREGQHITAVGADDPSKCELDAVALRRARVFVDTMAASEANGDVFQAIQRNEYEMNAIAGEIGSVLSGTRQGRVSKNDITLAKFVGIGAQDLAAAEVCLRKCQS